MISQEHYFALMYNRLVNTHAKFGLSNSFHDPSNKVNMGFFIFRIYEDIVQIGDNSFIKQVVENSIDHALKCGRGITKLEGHYPVLIQAIATSECGFPFLSLSHTDKVEPILEVELSEELRLS